MDLSGLLPPSWKGLITEWLKEDIPSFDYGGCVVGDKQEKALLLGKAKVFFILIPFVSYLK